MDEVNLQSFFFFFFLELPKGLYVRDKGKHLEVWEWFYLLPKNILKLDVAQHVGH
jgi:hypothetical protein